MLFTTSVIQERKVVEWLGARGGQLIIHQNKEFRWQQYISEFRVHQFKEFRVLVGDTVYIL